MIEKYERFLPIGTVVLLKNGNKRLMITSSYIKNSEGKIFDYNGCVYPEGLISKDSVYLFNHEQIDKIYFMGFIDEEEKKFKVQLKETIERNLKENLDIPKTIKTLNQDNS